MIETAKKNVDTKKYADKKDEDVSSSDYSDRLRDYIYQEWYALSLSTAYWDLLDKAVPLSKFQTKDEDRFGSRMMNLDGGYVQPPSRHIRLVSIIVINGRNRQKPSSSSC